MVCMSVIRVRLVHLIHSQHTVFRKLPHVLPAISLSYSSVSLMIQLNIS